MTKETGKIHRESTAGFPGARPLKILGVMLLLAVCALAFKTRSDLKPLPDSLKLGASDVRKVQILDRSGIPLTITYQNRWNIHDYVALHDIPHLLRQAFIHAEDKRFYSHGGLDWIARGHALIQNIRSLSAARGASTITEQVVRMLHPRPRTVWSRWIEGFEARRLEKKFSKADILEFYLNQVPYAAQRRGVLQAAHYYFNRDLDTLSTAEILSLAVLVRAPGRMNLHDGTEQIARPLSRLAGKLFQVGVISPEELRDLDTGGLKLEKPAPPLMASHFVHHVYAEGLDAAQRRGRLFTTIDSTLQYAVQEILDGRLRDLKRSNVNNGAVLVVDNLTNEVLVWVNGGGGGFSPDRHASHIDGVTTPRQPGSALKPFLYALAIEDGWTAATLIDDSPIASPVGTGLHNYRNYSGLNYGKLRMRDALGNSLNIPAVRTVQFVGVEAFLNRLHELGFRSLIRHPEHYGEGLALGNGEVTLLELVGAYATIARKGVFSPLVLVDGNIRSKGPGRRVLTEEAASVISSILSDPEARRLEFGRGNLLHFPTQTAVKTGTSTDYRDAWAVGFSSRYTVGAWMGNLDQQPMREITGSTGPALVLRAVFAELNRRGEAEPLYLSPGLAKEKICRISGMLAKQECPAIDEWFDPKKVPARPCELHHQEDMEDKVLVAKIKPQHTPLRMLKPTHGLQLAMDPRIPDELEAFAFKLPEDIDTVKVDWIVDGDIVGSTTGREFLWPLSRGTHKATAKVWLRENGPIETDVVTFHVK